MDFQTPREAMQSPLAVKLFAIEGVKGAPLSRLDTGVLHG